MSSIKIGDVVIYKPKYPPYDAKNINGDTLLEKKFIVTGTRLAANHLDTKPSRVYRYTLFSTETGIYMEVPEGYVESLE